MRGRATAIPANWFPADTFSESVEFSNTSLAAEAVKKAVKGTCRPVNAVTAASPGALERKSSNETAVYRDPVTM